MALPSDEDSVAAIYKLGSGMPIATRVSLALGIPE